MGTNDLYLIKKLKESCVTLDKLNYYLVRIKRASQEQTSPSSNMNSTKLDTNTLSVRPIFQVSREEYKDPSQRGQENDNQKMKGN